MSRIAVLVFAWLFSPFAAAQEYPVRAVTMVVPFPPGGGNQRPGGGNQRPGSGGNQRPGGNPPPGGGNHRPGGNQRPGGNF